MTLQERERLVKERRCIVDLEVITDDDNIFIAGYGLLHTRSDCLRVFDWAFKDFSRSNRGRRRSPSAAFKLLDAYRTEQFFATLDTMPRLVEIWEEVIDSVHPVGRDEQMKVQYIYFSGAAGLLQDIQRLARVEASEQDKEAYLQALNKLIYDRLKNVMQYAAEQEKEAQSSSTLPLRRGEIPRA